MTRKDYEVLAEAIKTAQEEIANKEPEEYQKDLLDGVQYAAEFIADALQTDNPRFDRTRFLAACGID